MSWLEKKLATLHKMRDLKRIVKKIKDEAGDSDIPEAMADLVDRAEVLIEALEDFLIEAIPEVLIEEITDNPLFRSILRKLFDDWKADW